MKSIVVSLDNPLDMALREQWRVRARDYHPVDMADLLVQGDTALASLGGEIAVLILRSDSLGVGPVDDLERLLQILIQYCGTRQLPLLMVSSCRVIEPFAGANRYRESQAIEPESAAATTLWSLEQALRDNYAYHLIVRLGPLFSSTVLVDSMLAEFRRGGPQRFAETGRAAPTHVADAARVLSAIVDQISCGADVWGTYHYNSAEPVSHYRFAEAALAVYGECGNAASVELVGDDTLGATWTAPLLNCEKILNTFGIKQLPWRAYLSATIRALLAPPVEELKREQS